MPHSIEGRMSRGRRASRRLPGGTLAAVSLIAGLLAAHALAAPAHPSTRETAGCIRDPRCHRIFVVAHRAKGFDAPENSREAAARAVAAGVRLIKIDLRASKDGELFVLHDGKLQTTTTLAGRIESIPSDQLAKARLRNGERLPRFTEVYDLTRDRAVLVVGFKVDEVGRIADWIHQHGSFDDLVFFVNTGEAMRSAALAKQRYPQMMVMARLLDTRVTVDTVKSIFGGLPEILHTERVGAAEVARLHALGAKVFMNVVPLEGYLQPFKYFAVGSVLRTGLDFVLTDEPMSVLGRVTDPSRR